MQGRKAENGNGVEVDAELVDDLTIEPDIEVVEDPSQPGIVQIGSDLYLRLDDVSVVNDLDSDPLDVAEPRWRLLKHISPELVAGIVIGLLFGVFAILMYVGVSEESSDQGSVEAVPEAPVAEVEVEIGTALVVERE